MRNRFAAEVRSMRKRCAVPKWSPSGPYALNAGELGFAARILSRVSIDEYTQARNASDGWHRALDGSVRNGGFPTPAWVMDDGAGPVP